MYLKWNKFIYFILIKDKSYCTCQIKFFLYSTSGMIVIVGPKWLVENLEGVNKLFQLLKIFLWKQICLPHSLVQFPCFNSIDCEYAFKELDWKLN